MDTKVFIPHNSNTNFNLGQFSENNLKIAWKSPGDAAALDWLDPAWDCSCLLAWTCLLPPWDSLHCSRLACLHCTSPGVPNWRHHSVPWLRITVDSWGTSGVGGTSAPPCCCLLAANMLHTLQPEPPRSKLTCTTDYSEQLWCCNCALSAVAAPVSWKYIAKWITVKYKIILCTLSNIPS